MLKRLPDAGRVPISAARRSGTSRGRQTARGSLFTGAAQARYSRAVISRVRTPSSSTYHSPMIILIAGNTS